MSNKTVCIDEIKGCEGNCITMNDYRVAGPKPWGSGIVVKNWVAKVDDVITALRDNDVVKVVRCKDCKHRGSVTYCPMVYEEWYEIDEGYGDYDSDFITRDLTIDNGFCDRGERKDKDA